MIALIAMIIGLTVAHAEPMGCAQVRAYVAQVGPAVALANGRAYGMTPQQEAVARACLRTTRRIRR
jgi:hypothetical protein